MIERLYIAMLAAVLVSGCASSDVETTPVTNAESGVSATSDGGAVWLAADRPGLSNVGRDFLFVGPMTINRDAVQRRYLWFAFASTIDRRLTGAPDRPLESVIITVDGTPMTFDVDAWNAPSGTLPYELPITPTQSLVALVTRSQLKRLAAADDIEAYVLDGNARSPRYRLAKGNPAGWWLTGEGSLATVNQ